MEYNKVIKQLKSLRNSENVKGMVRFGIRPKAKVYGIPIPELRKIAKFIKKDHKLALKLWDSKIHEAKILAGLIADPEKTTEKQINKWVKNFDSWDICDQTCMNLFCKTRFAYKKVFEFSKRKEEFVRRTAFALISALAVHDKKATNKDFVKFFSIIEKAVFDERNFVKKAVNWSLRQIGKRNPVLNKKSISLAKKIIKINSKSAKWIAGNAIRELESKKIQKMLSYK
ncbi:MAG: DNA alkylation repair protein [Candidatus Woesearchaeota archaeon]|nr:DNA alkylation repair protein [Candidatus Woesearchaeota archaeon]